jgi:hypothetical protein
LINHLGSKLPKSRIALLDSENEWVGLSGCFYWGSVLFSSALALIFLGTEGLGQDSLSGSEDLLTAVAALSWLPLFGGVLQCYAAHWATERGQPGFGVSEATTILICHVFATWLLSGLSIVARIKGITQLLVLLFVVSVLGAAMIAYAVTLRKKSGRCLAVLRPSCSCLTGANLAKCVGYGGVSLLLGGSLAVLCGRTVGAPWATAVPTLVLVAPMQVPSICLALTCVADGCTASGCTAMLAAYARCTAIIDRAYARCAALRCPERCTKWFSVRCASVRSLWTSFSLGVQSRG